ncbi:MAG TPA: MnhB domain-containing protein [Acidimicrobiales bacterium]
MTRSPIVDTVAQLIFHSAIVLSLYLLFAGHNQPGGGFVGGLVASAAVAVHYVAGGIDDVRSLSRLRPWTILGSGLVLAGVAAVAPLIGGGAVLESGYLLDADLPVLGHVKVLSTLVFDAGVYAVVVGLMLMVFEAVGEEAEPEGRR